MPIVPAKAQATKKLLDAAAELAVQIHIDSGDEIVKWLRIHHGIDIAMADISNELRLAAKELELAYGRLSIARNRMDAAQEMIPNAQNHD